TVSHELRTPLTAIRATAEILHDNPDTPPAKRAQFVDIILSETERLTRLIDQILDLARLESGRATWTAEPVDPGEIVRQAEADTQTTDPPSGSGLGLPISRLIVRQFGGDLSVESEQGRGATFSFTLPIANAVQAGAL